MRCPHCGQGHREPAPIIPLVAGGQGKTARDTIGTAEGLCWVIGVLAWFWLLAWSGCVAS